MELAVLLPGGQLPDHFALLMPQGFRAEARRIAVPDALRSLEPAGAVIAGEVIIRVVVREV